MSQTSWSVILISDIFSYHCHRLILWIILCHSLQHCWSVSQLWFHCWSVFCWGTNTVNANLYKTLSLFPVLSASLSVSSECESCRGKSYWSWPWPSQPANKSLTSREEPNENVRLKKSVCERESLIGRGLLKHLAVWQTALAPGPAWIWIHWEILMGYLNILGISVFI